MIIMIITMIIIIIIITIIIREAVKNYSADFVR